MKVDVRVSPAPTEPPALVTRVGYRAVQEWLENIGRHAQARSVLVTVRFNAAMLDVQIADDGIGFDLGDASAVSRIGHIGLPRLRADAHAIGAQIEIEKDHPSGTRMRWHWDR